MKKGKKVLLIILAIFVIIAGAAAYWVSGIKKVEKDFGKYTQVPTESETKLYEQVFSQKGSTAIGNKQVTLNSNESGYVTSRMFKDTDFLNTPSDSPVQTKDVVLNVENDKVHMEAVVDIKDASAMALPSTLTGTYGIDAMLDCKTVSEGIAIKPVSVSIGKSSIPVSTLLAGAKKSGEMKVTEEGYIIISPMQLTDKATGKDAGTIKGIEIVDGKLVLTFK